MLNYEAAPENMRGGLRRFIENGVEPGGALMAILSNDLKEAFARADDTTTANMRNIVVWLYNESPGNCWGSKDNVRAWIAKGGMGAQS